MLKTSNVKLICACALRVVTECYHSNERHHDFDWSNTFAVVEDSKYTAAKTARSRS